MKIVWLDGRNVDDCAFNLIHIAYFCAFYNSVLFGFDFSDLC